MAQRDTDGPSLNQVLNAYQRYAICWQMVRPKKLQRLPQALIEFRVAAVRAVVGEGGFARAGQRMRRNFVE